MPLLLAILFTLRLVTAEAMADAAEKTAIADDIAVTLKGHDQRMDLYDVIFYGIDLEVPDTSTLLSGSTSILIKVLDKPVNELVFDLLADLRVDSVWLDGKVTAFNHADDQLIVMPQAEVTAQKRIMVTVYYSGLGRQKEWISGVYNVKQDVWNKRITWTLSEPFAARNWFPCKQVLSDKADSATIFITTAGRLKAGANGLLEHTIVLPEDRIRYEWKTRYPIAYYLLSFAVGDYADYSFYVPLPGRNDSLLVQNYIYDTLAYFEQNKSDIDKTAELIVLYSELFGTYPFHAEKYGHCIVPSGGGMEHQTMTTLGNFYYLLVAHELAHQWFGDYVTCGSWQDIWINEGFASYAEYLAYQYLQSQDKADTWMAEAHDYIKSAGGGSVFIPESDADDEERIFDYRLSYKKGAAILHMIRGEVQNDSLFFALLRDYLARFKNSVALGKDFKQLLEEKTGWDFSTFFDQWYYGAGYPSITVNWKHEHDTLFLYSFLTASSDATPQYDLLTGYKITLNNGDTTVYKRHNTHYDEWKIKLPGNVKSIMVDPEKWLLMDVTGVNNLSKREPDKKFYVAPNPAKNRISINFEDSMTETKIYVIDSAGKILFADKPVSFPFTLELDGYKSGSYIVLAENEDRIYTEKFVLFNR